MTEQPNVSRQSAGDDEPTTARDDDTGLHAPVRTQGETAVDEAMGTGDNVH
jgi:hypothetical protein